MSFSRDLNKNSILNPFTSDKGFTMFSYIITYELLMNGLLGSRHFQYAVRYSQTVSLSSLEPSDILKESIVLYLKKKKNLKNLLKC